MKRRLIFSIFSLFFSITASAQKTDPAGVHFEKAYEEINGMLTGKNPLSFKRAVFLSENAYMDNSLSYSAFDFSIKASASYCQRMAQNIPLNHPKEKPLGVNYAIFQHITDTTKHIFGKDTFDFLPFRYDFNDFSGQKSWESMFVTKLLRERTGNCRSLPYYYKILADECGVEAFLALAPNHIYIKHRDVGQKKEGWQRRVYNIELTNGSFPMDGWLMASGYITLDAIRSGYYLDTLSRSQAVAMCLFDLGKAYERKFGKRDEFVSRCVERVLAIHPANINALLLKTELLKDRYERTKQPADYEAVEKHCSTLVANGYREMPLDMYLNWLFEVRAKGDAFVNVKRQPKKFDTQKGNPYKNDTTMKIHMQTLTDGRYDEFPEFAETTYVGSAVYDVYKKKIIGFIKRDTLYSEATLEPEVVSRWLSTDPVFHPYESPYVAFADNPVYFVDPNGTTVGDYFSQKTGAYLGSDGKDDKKIYSVSKTDGKLPDSDFVVADLSDRGRHFMEHSSTHTHRNSEGKVTMQYNKLYDVKELSLNKEEFMNRAYWMFGESRGAFPDYYAHTIANAREAGPSGRGLVPFKSDAQMMSSMMKVMENGKIVSKYADFLAGTFEGINYKDFYNAKSSFGNLQVKLPESKDIFRALIQQNLGITKDPTNGAIGWLGGLRPGGINPQGEAYKSSVKKTDAKGYNHYFHSYK